ncbi:outer membrane protein assembly factor BamB [Chryseobacterium bernardetii]|uniref:Outer membrane protein assembly factor BamB n=2 Tax=Chryseobacterium TaxID=59732 RepID=A0ACC6IWB3_9FLAO|nr:MULTISPECIES: PQQ-binding-like beta-propeller repeat protein [Chryseobacterium]MDR6371523.1 outer membrane protein assembly factor BamB [Chryseobacterium vietnamense]MDR6441972.1 outer membrane protein assembly factor BamB [Chryseobacterium bernardetii]
MKFNLFICTILIISSIGCSSSDENNETPTDNNPKNIMFIGGTNEYYAINSQNGQLKWVFSVLNGRFQYSTAFYSNNVLYVGCTDSYLYAIDASKGTLLWKFKTNEAIESSVYVYNNTVFFGSDDDNFYALNTATGELKWKYTAGFNVSSSPVVSGDIVYFASDDGYVYALEQGSGALKWKYYTGSIFNSSSSSIVGNNLYIGNRNGNIYNINKNTGQLNWEKQLGSSVEYSSPTILDGYLYVTDKNALYKMDAVTGNIIWQSYNSGNYSSSPFVNENYITVNSSSGNLTVIDKQTGNTRWQKTIYSNSAEAVSTDGTVFIGGGGSNYVYAFSENDGTEKWRFPMKAVTTSAPVIINKDGKVVYPSKSGGRD